MVFGLREGYRKGWDGKFDMNGGGEENISGTIAYTNNTNGCGDVGPLYLIGPRLVCSRTPHTQQVDVVLLVGLPSCHGDTQTITWEKTMLDDCASQVHDPWMAIWGFKNTIHSGYVRTSLKPPRSEIQPGPSSHPGCSCVYGTYTYVQYLLLHRKTRSLWPNYGQTTRRRPLYRK